jgi:hypothetical protein
MGYFKVALHHHNQKPNFDWPVRRLQEKSAAAAVIQ